MVRLVKINENEIFLGNIEGITFKFFKMIITKDNHLTNLM